MEKRYTNILFEKKGAELVYYNFLEKWLNKYEFTIDEDIDLIKERVKNEGVIVLKEVATNLFSFLSAKLKELFNKAKDNQTIKEVTKNVVSDVINNTLSDNKKDMTEVLKESLQKNVTNDKVNQVINDASSEIKNQVQKQLDNKIEEKQNEKSKN